MLLINTEVRNNLKENMEIVQEAYFGKDKLLLEAEAAIVDLGKLASSQLVRKRNMDLSASKPNIALQKALEKKFGCASVEIVWDNLITDNAMTTPYVHGFVGLQPIINRVVYMKDGNFNRRHAKMFIIVSASLIQDEFLTSGETLAIILHEMGHNFDKTFLSVVGMLPFQSFLDTLKAMGIMTLTSKAVSIVFREVNKLISKHQDGLGPFLDAMVSANRELKNIAPLQGLINIIKGPNLEKRIEEIWNITNLKYILASYGSERFSDSFATSYGYGPELVSGLKKLTTYSLDGTVYGELRKSVKPFNYAISLSSVICELVSSIASTHPVNQTRYKNTINKLKRDAKDPRISESMRKAIYADIEKCEELYDSFINMEDEPELKNAIIVSYRKTADALFGGKIGWREVFNPIYAFEEL